MVINYILMGEVNLLHYLILVTYRLVCLLNWLVTIRICSSFFTDFMFTCRQKLVACIWLEIDLLLVLEDMCHVVDCCRRFTRTILQSEWPTIVTPCLANITHLVIWVIVLVWCQGVPIVREQLDLSGGQRCARMLSIGLVLRYLNTLYRGILAVPFAQSWRIGLQSISTNLRCRRHAPRWI